MSSTWDEMIAIVVIAISVFLMALIYSLLLAQLFCYQNKIIPFFKISSIICLSCCISSSIGDLIHMLIAYTKDIPPSDTERLFVIIIIADIMYFIGSVSLYIYVFGKLYFTFNATKYVVSKYVVFFVLLIISILSISIAGYLYTIATCPEFKFYKQSEKYLISLIINDILLDGTLLTLFVNKLQHLLNDSYFAELALSQNDNDINLNFSTKHLNTKQNTMIHVMTRQSVVGSIIIIFNSLFFITTFIDHFLVDGTSFTPAIEFELSYSLRAIENIVIMIMVYLNFTFSTSLYLKMCSLCHSGCFICCQKCIKFKIQKRINQQIVDSSYYRL